MKNFSPLQNLAHLRILAAVVSICLSVLINKYDYLINLDGILYLKMAEAFITGGLSSASQLYDWPFFAILIGLISKYSWLDIHISAIVLNTFFFVILTDGLLLVCHQGLRSIPQTAIAALVVLCFYTLNEYRDFIIRDVGYWAMSIWAVYHFIKFIDEGHKSRLFLWQLFAITAVLFRIEGLIILLLMPITIFFSANHSGKLKHITLAYLPLLIIAAVAAVMLFYDTDLRAAFSKIDEFEKYFHYEKLMTPFWQDKEIIANQVIPPVARDQAGILLISGLIGVVLHDIFTGLSISLLILAALSIRTQPMVNKSYNLVLISFLLINLLILFSFAIGQQFITTRYCILAILAIVLLLIPKLTVYIQSNINGKNHFKVFLVILLLSLSLVDTFHKTQTKKYIKDAITWTAQNTDSKVNIFTNNEHVSFYLAYLYQHPNVTFNERKLDGCQYDYAVIVERHIHKRLSRSIKKCDWQVHRHFEEGNRSVKIYMPLSTEN